MGFKYQKSHRDKNEPEIIKALEQTGCLVQSVNEKDVPDLLVAIGQRIVFVEVKNKEGLNRISKGQKGFGELWPHVYVIRTVDEAIELVNNIRSNNDVHTSRI